MALNDPRSIPYAFRVFEKAGFVWLYDESERSYPCTATPHIYAVALYCLGEGVAVPRGDDQSALFAVSRGADPAIEGSTPVAVDLAADVSDFDAWDTAMSFALAIFTFLDAPNSADRSAPHG